MTFWSVFWRLCVFFPVGAFWCAYGLIAPLICLRFGIPATNYLQSRISIDSNSIRKKYWGSVILWLAIDVTGITIVATYASSATIYGLIAGAIITFITGIGKTKINVSNITDYLTTNNRWIGDENRDEAARELTKLSIFLNNGELR